MSSLCELYLISTLYGGDVMIRSILSESICVVFRTSSLRIEMRSFRKYNFFVGIRIQVSLSDEFPHYNLPTLADQITVFPRRNLPLLRKLIRGSGSGGIM